MRTTKTKYITMIKPTSYIKQNVHISVIKIIAVSTKKKQSEKPNKILKNRNQSINK